MTPDAPHLDPEQLAAYFALTDVGSLLQYAVEQQLREDGDLSSVQFQIIARLTGAPSGRLRMTDLADGIVYSRSGLTYQVGVLEKAGLVVRGTGPDDERTVVVSLTAAGRDRFFQVLPGHVEVVRRLLVDPLDRSDLATLRSLMDRVLTHMRAAPPRSARPRPPRKPSA
ncbi:MarR family winged helix-turn-helix transcriptional regulator [Dactylosporangium sp. CA-092794]|uniref:MarR family winged helix-turn-helix transcriptional regulator n=1 Tax=Dactylosporangium sp. CA-092794 TaxID=3239929 RepID=UPI003D8FDD44